MNETQLSEMLALLEQVETNAEYKDLFGRHLIASQQFSALLEELTPEQQDIIHAYIHTLSLMRKYED